MGYFETAAGANAIESIAQSLRIIAKKMPNLREEKRPDQRALLRHCQQILADNGIESDETATVLQALCFSLLHRDVAEELDWSGSSSITDKEDTP